MTSMANSATLRPPSDYFTVMPIADLGFRMMRLFPGRLMLLATGTAYILATPSALRAETSYEPFVACDARVKDVIYVSPASKWGGPVQQGKYVDSNPYWKVWNLALAAVGGDWRNNQGCETGNSKSEVEAKVREHARRRYTDSPPIEVLGWALEPGYKAPKDLPAKLSASEGYLVVEDTGAAERKNAWNDVVLQTQREDAARQVKIAVATAEQKARNEALTQKMLSEMRKRGRAQ